MSPNVGNFVHDLVEMAKAMERLPDVEADLAKANGAIESYAKQVQDREISIIGYKEQIEFLQARIRGLEVARDDAELRFLELDEKAHKVIRAMEDSAVMLGVAIGELVPPKPQPEPVKEPEPTQARDTSADWFEDHDHVRVADVVHSISEVPTSLSDPIVQSTTASAIVDQTIANTTTNQDGSGQRDLPPTSTPPAPIGTGTEQDQSGSDIEPTRFRWVGDVKETTKAWWEWYDRQSHDFKRDYEWNKA